MAYKVKTINTGKKWRWKSVYEAPVSKIRTEYFSKFAQRQNFAIHFWEMRLKEARTKKDKREIKDNIQKFKEFKKWGIRKGFN